MGASCGTYRRETHKGFRWGNLKEKDHLKDLDVDGRTVLRDILKLDTNTWTLPAVYRNKWRGFVRIVTKFRVPYNVSRLGDPLRNY